MGRGTALEFDCFPHLYMIRYIEIERYRNRNWIDLSFTLLHWIDLSFTLLKFNLLLFP